MRSWRHLTSIICPELMTLPSLEHRISRAVVDTAAGRNLPRGLSTSAPDTNDAQAKASNEFTHARAAFNSKLNDLRKSWAEEHRLKQEAREARWEARRQRQARLRQRKEAEKQLGKEERAQAHLERMAALAEESAAKAEARAEWRQTVEAIYERFREQRKGALLQESAKWISREELDDRILDALGRPDVLYIEDKAPDNTEIVGFVPGKQPADFDRSAPIRRPTPSLQEPTAGSAANQQALSAPPPPPPVPLGTDGTVR